MFEKREIRLAIYYVLLLILYLVGSFYKVDIGSFARLIALGLIVGPLLIYQIEWFPAVTTMFYSIGTSNYSTTLLPTAPNTYLIVLLVGVLFFKPKSQFPILMSLVILAVLTFIINLTTYGAWENVTSAIIWTITFFFYVPFNEKKNINVFSYAFAVISLVISISRILFGSTYTSSYDVAAGLDRTALIDANYAACVVGMGIVSSVILLLHGESKNIFIRIMLIVTIVLSVVTLALNASRTSFLALAAAIFVLVIFSNVRKSSKIVTVILIAALLIIMYNNSYFDLLQYRVENDVGGGSYRSEIWQIKIRAFYEGDIWKRIFGYGYEPARNMGWAVALHNDYLAFCCEYGYIGLVLLLSLFIVPFRYCGIRKAPAIAALVYLLVVMLTLEPFAAGRVPYYAFWFYALLLSVVEENSEKM